MGAISLAGASDTGIATALTKKYQKELAKVTKLTDIVTSALAVFETSVSTALNNARLTNGSSPCYRSYTTDHLLIFPTLTTRWKQKTEINLKKSMGRNQRPKEEIKKKRWLMMAHSFPCGILLATKMDKLQSIYHQPSHLSKARKPSENCESLVRKS